METPTNTQAKGLVPGARVAHILVGRKTGTITRVIDADGALGGLVEVRWDGQRLSRSAGFFGANEVRAL
jgi:hypothetical protein